MTREATWLIAAFSLALMGGLLVASNGFFIVDEVIYFVGAQAYQATGSFFIDNGFGEFGSNDLRMWLLRGRPEGLTPQYPPGSATLGGWLMTAFGLKGMLVLNTLAAVATLPVTYALSRRLFDDAPALLAVVLLALCTFWIEYVHAFWPHAISVLLMSLALLLFLPSLDPNQHAWRSALLAGLITGICLLVRLDGLLILPFFVLATILYANRPVSVLSGGALGMLPGLLLLAVLNATKFGVFNPLTYGHSNTGGTNLAAYAAPAALLAAAFGALLWVRLRGQPRPYVLVGIAAVVVALALLVPAVGSLALKLLRGIDHILIDIHGIPDNREGVVRGADRTTLFWGLPKKALAQSLPWLGVLTALIFLPKRRSTALVLMFFALWSLPFVLRSWHGGLGSNMRYLLPTVPALCVLTGWVIHSLVHRIENGWRWVGLGAGAGLAGAVLWTLFHASGLPGTHQVMSLIVFAILAAAALLSRMTVRPVLAVFGVALGVSSFLAASDVISAQSRRARTAEHAALIAELPPKTVVYHIPEVTWPAALQPERMAAIYDARSGEIDAEFIRDAMAKGYRVLVAASWVERFETIGFSVADTAEFEAMGLKELRP